MAAASRSACATASPGCFRRIYRRWSGKDVRSAIAAWIADFVGSRRAVRLAAEIDEHPLVNAQAAPRCVAVDLHEPGALFGDLGIELIIPSAVERIGDIKP